MTHLTTTSQLTPPIPQVLAELGYSAPADVAAAAARLSSGKPYAHCLDAGCGTGLAGPVLRPLVTGALVGVDLSPEMVRGGGVGLGWGGEFSSLPHGVGGRGGEGERGAKGGGGCSKGMRSPPPLM